MNQDFFLQCFGVGEICFAEYHKSELFGVIIETKNFVKSKDLS